MLVTQVAYISRSSYSGKPVRYGTQHNSNPELGVGSSFRVIPGKCFSGAENVSDFLENIDNNLTYYEIPTQLACAYLKGHLTGRALDWFDVLGYKVVEEKVTDYAHLKQALTEQFPVVRNRLELETRFYASYQNRNERPSEFVYELLKIHKQLKLDMAEEKLLDHVKHKQLKLDMAEEKLLDHVNSRLEPQLLDYVERDTRVNNRYQETSRQQRESNRFGQGVGDNRRFDSRRRSDQSDPRFNNPGGRQSGSRNSAFRGQNSQNSRMPFGLSGAAPNFQKAIDIIIKPVLGRFVGCYMDDVIITSPSFTEQIDHLHQVFTLLRDAEAPVLQLPNFQEQFNLFTDASGVRIGAVLNQNHRPIAFASGTLNKAERNYTVTERECLAVIWALNEFRTYFGVLPVKVITNDVVLKKTHEWKNLSSRMIRWALKLTEFKIEWEHQPGTQNVVADVLSRNPVDNVEGSQISYAALRALALNSREHLIREQREDPELGHIYRYLENQDDDSVKTSRLAKEDRDIEHKCTTITLDDANAVAKHRIINHTFKKPLVTEFDCPRIITSTIARLRTEHLKGMKIHPDKKRPHVQCKHCPDLPLTPNHILECPTVATKLLKMGMVPLRDSLRELLYSPDAPRIAEAVIKTFDGI
ncbi:retrovirus-related Pol polyprotein from transposon 17.6 [Trichonephila clavipes]|nr:retrovirus-related Pol polyprotein from transposon 17.6 [Trichonephila clavipes]